MSYNRGVPMEYILLSVDRFVLGGALGGDDFQALKRVRPPRQLPLKVVTAGRPRQTQWTFFGQSVNQTKKQSGITARNISVM